MKFIKIAPIKTEDIDGWILIASVFVIGGEAAALCAAFGKGNPNIGLTLAGVLLIFPALIIWRIAGVSTNVSCDDAIKKFAEHMSTADEVRAKTFLNELRTTELSISAVYRRRAVAFTAPKQVCTSSESPEKYQ